VEAFVERIVEEVRREPGTLVLPMTDRTLLPLSSRREAVFEAGGQLVLSPHDTILRTTDKLQATQLAESLGIAVPQTALLTTQEQATELARSARYPLVLKPRSTEETSPAGRLLKTGGPAYASCPAEFLSSYESLRRRSSAILVQDFVGGTGAGYFALLRHGEVRAEFAHQRVRDVLPTGSGSAVRISIPLDPRVRKAGSAILRALRWHGVAMVEFRIRPDGTPVFLEVNGRFWNSLPLAVCAGVDFPALLTRMIEGGDVEGPDSYQVGVRCRWLLGDFRHLLQVWRGVPVGYPGQFPGRLATAVRFFLPVPGTHHDNFTLLDPLPEVGDWVDFALRQLPDVINKGRGTNPSPETAKQHA
jgi:predicted ATP-grasp superfamily ATP-dependent carboligase